MKVKITDPAKASLKEICGHYRRLGFDTYAVKIRRLIDPGLTSTIIGDEEQATNLDLRIFLKLS